MQPVNPFKYTQTSKKHIMELCIKSDYHNSNADGGCADGTVIHVWLLLLLLLCYGAARSG